MRRKTLQSVPVKPRPVRAPQQHPPDLLGIELTPRRTGKQRPVRNCHGPQVPVKPRKRRRHERQDPSLSARPNDGQRWFSLGLGDIDDAGGKQFTDPRTGKEHQGNQRRAAHPVIVGGGKKCLCLLRQQRGSLLGLPAFRTAGSAVISFSAHHLAKVSQARS